jgi:hypothetical protein
MIRRQNRMKTSPGAAAMEILRKQGRNGDTELAHVNPREKALLKALGGAGSRNPRTGLREYFDGSADLGSPAGDTGGIMGDSTGLSPLGGDTPSFGGLQGSYFEGASAVTPSRSPGQEGVDYGEDFGPTAPPNAVQTGASKIGEVLTDPDAIPGFGIVGNLVGRAMSALGRQARSAYGPDAVADPAFEGGRQMEAFMGGPDFPGNLGTGLGEMRNEAFVPVANPTPRYLRGGEMAPPQEISSFIGPGMSDIQQRALISTYGTQGVNSAFRTDPVRRYYANLLSRGLISDAGAPVQNPYVLPIEQQYASSVLGRPFANPADAAATYESIRGFL